MLVKYNLQPELVWISLFIWLIPLYVNRSFILKGIKKQNNSYFAFFLCLSLYAILGFAEADTYGYHSIYDHMVNTHNQIHVEPYYFWLAKQIPYSYYLWRFAIWGLGAYLTVITLKICNIKAWSASIMAPLLFYVQFTLTRGSLSFACMMLSMCLFINLNRSKNNLLYLLVSPLLLYAAFHLHKSAPIFLLLIPFAYFLKFNRFTFYFSIAIFPILYSVTMLIIDNFIGSRLLADDTMNFFEYYTEDLELSTSIWGYVGQFILFSPFFLLFYLMIKFYIIDKNYITPRLSFFLKLSYVLFYIMCLFYEQNLSSFMSTRAFHAAMFPLLIVSSKYIEDSVWSKSKKYMLLMFLFSCVYGYLYLIYSWSKI